MEALYVAKIGKLSMKIKELQGALSEFKQSFKTKGKKISSLCHSDLQDFAADQTKIINELRQKLARINEKYGFLSETPMREIYGHLKDLQAMDNICN